MRLKLILCSVAGLASALLLAGCGMEQVSTNAPNVESPALAGRAFAGQQPVSGATISVVAMGTSGYGSSGTVLASVTTDSGGGFSFAPEAYTCPQSDTPVYLLGVGGNSGGGNNSSAVLGAGLGTCANGKNSFIILNEVTTVGLAFALAHFFSTTATIGLPPAVNDSFGGPSTTAGGTVHYSKGLVMGNNVTIPTIVFNAIGAANQTVTNASGTTYTVEWQKINTMANILLACVNTSGATSSSETSTPCGRLFNFTANEASPRPSDTLQAAVQMALHPISEVTNLYNLINTTPAFTPYLTEPPNDWTIGVAYTNSSVALAVDTGTLSTLDIDASGRVWLPSSAEGKAGAAYFDPASQSFNGPFNSTGLVHPQQVVIDANGYAWYNDNVTPTVAGYLISAPTTTQSESLPRTVSTSLTVTGDGLIGVGVTVGELFSIATIPADRSSYSLISEISFPYRAASMAGDVNNGGAVAVSSPTTTQMQNVYVSSTGGVTTIVSAKNTYSGQVIYTGNDFVSIRSAPTKGSSNDGLCIYSTATCYSIHGGTKNALQGMAIDGHKDLWVTESGNGGLLQVPENNPTASFGSVYVDPTGGNVSANEFLHGLGNGSTMPLPYGIGVDATGNLWVTNAGCTEDGCTPGSFTLTEIVGAGFPTITPISAQIPNGTNLVGTEPTN